MTEQDKQLLLTDLCARLPYGVIFNYCSEVGCDYKLTIISNSFLDEFPIEDCKPYLRPMPDIQDPLLNELNDLITNKTFYEITSIAQDWYNKHHFDYRGLIEKGLALEAPEGMYKKF